MDFSSYTSTLEPECKLDQVLLTEKYQIRRIRILTFLSNNSSNWRVLSTVYLECKQTFTNCSLIYFVLFQVAQSLLWLLAFFWHVTRPLLAILIDPDLPLNGCCGSKSSGTGNSRPVELYDLVEEAAPLREVMQQPQPFKSKSEMMMNSDEDANQHSTLDV